MLTADTGVIAGRQSGLIVLAITVAAGIAVAGTWLTLAGPARRAAISLAARRPFRSLALRQAAGAPARRAIRWRTAGSLTRRAARSLAHRRGRHIR